MIVFVCGLSRSGKSHMLEAVLVNCTGVQHLRASELLRASGRPTALISAADALLNQEVFIAAAKAAIERTSDNIIIDGHLMIESADGPQLVPETCFDALPLVGMVVIEAPPTEIVRRRVEIEPALTADEAADRMELERIHARRIARRRNIRFAAVERGASIICMMSLRGCSGPKTAAELTVEYELCLAGTIEADELLTFLKIPAVQETSKLRHSLFGDRK